MKIWPFDMLIRLAVVLLAMCTASAAQTSTSKGILRFGYTTGTTSFDPARSSSGGDRALLLPVYDRLVRLSNQGEPQPMLATKWEFTRNGAGLVLTLRQGVTFQDGTSVDADAVKANLDRFRTLPESTQRSALGAITDVRVVDATHVAIECNNGCGGLIQTLGDTAGMMVSPKAFANPDLGSHPVGAGAYTLTEYRPGTRAVYKAVNNYYDPANQPFDGIEITVFADDATRLNALRSGQIDMTLLRPYQVAEAKAAKLNVVGSRGAIWYYMGMNMNRGKFSDIRVRQALNYAIDKKQISDSLLAGYCTPSDQPIREGVLGFAKQTPKVVYPYNPAKAKQLLSEAGLGKGFEFDAVVYNIPLFVQIAEAVQAQLAQIDVKMNLQPMPVPQAISAYFGKGTVDGYVGINLGQNDPSALLANLYLKDGFFNPSKFTTPAIVEAYRKSMEHTDNGSRQAAFEALVKNALSQAYHVGICDVLTPVAYTNAVKGVTPEIPTWTWDFYGLKMVGP
jgi:peptide/nickel transport system substrate-binding protein